MMISRRIWRVPVETTVAYVLSLFDGTVWQSN
jgi:hypothetical protein